MKIIALSDTHLRASLSSILNGATGDVLVHAGDALDHGFPEEFYRFLGDLKAVRHQFKHVLYVPGNHDIFVDQLLPVCRRDLAEIGVDLLANNLIELDGITFYGNPAIPMHRPWAFGYGSNGSMEDLKAWENMPACDVLITHVPPAGILSNEWGSSGLRERVERIRPKIHIFGHVHSQRGYLKVGKTDFYNVATCSEEYSPNQGYREIYIDREPEYKPRDPVTFEILEDK